MRRGERVALGTATDPYQSPILPGLTDRERSLDAVIGAAARAGVRRLWGSLLFLRSPTKEKYFAFLAGEFPRHLEAYERAYARTSHLRGRYRDRVEALVERLSRKHGFGHAGSCESEAYARLPEQLDLFSQAVDARAADGEGRARGFRRVAQGAPA